MNDIIHDTTSYMLLGPSLFRSSARALSTPAPTFAELLTGYNLSVLCSSSFGHSQVGHSMVLLSGVVLRSIPFLPHVNDFDIAVRNGPHQALVQVVVDFIRVEVWMVKNPLYQIL